MQHFGLFEHLKKDLMPGNNKHFLDYVLLQFFSIALVHFSKQS